MVERNEGIREDFVLHEIKESGIVVPAPIAWTFYQSDTEDGIKRYFFVEPKEDAEKTYDTGLTISVMEGFEDATGQSIQEFVETHFEDDEGVFGEPFDIVTERRYPMLYSSGYSAFCDLRRHDRGNGIIEDERANIYLAIKAVAGNIETGTAYAMQFISEQSQWNTHRMIGISMIHGTRFDPSK